MTRRVPRIRYIRWIARIRLPDRPLPVGIQQLLAVGKPVSVAIGLSQGNSPLAPGIVVMLTECIQTVTPRMTGAATEHFTVWNPVFILIPCPAGK